MTGAAPRSAPTAGLVAKLADADIRNSDVVGAPEAITQAPRLLRSVLRRIPGLRAAYRQARCLQEIMYVRWFANRARLNDHFHITHEWNFETSEEKLRYSRVLGAIEQMKSGDDFGEVLETACAEGLFTLQLGERCSALTACDISPVAVERARQRCAGIRSISFHVLDLQADPLVGQYDVIFVMCILEAIHGQRELREVGKKLVAALRDGGLLLLNEVRLPEELEHKWWVRRFGEGGLQKIERLAEQPEVTLVRKDLYSDYVIAVFQKQAKRAELLH